MELDKSGRSVRWRVPEIGKGKAIVVGRRLRKRNEGTRGFSVDRVFGRFIHFCFLYIMENYIWASHKLGLKPTKSRPSQIIRISSPPNQKILEL